jgi:AraC-like DNA-binding protein
MKPNIELHGDTFIDARSHKKAFSYEQFCPEHLIAYQISGKTQIYHESGELILDEGQFLIARRNQFAKSVKHPAKNDEYRCVSVLLSIDRLRQYASENGIICRERYDGRKNVILDDSIFLKGYFQSIMPYIDHWRPGNDKLAAYKVTEAVELILQLRSDLKSYLFDFADPTAQDLEAFMLKHFRYNAPLEYFAKLSGRSLSTFKRDFVEVFSTSPAQWLKDRRLSEAYYLIGQQRQKPDDIYLALGFENLSHFYSSFKKKYGLTPKQIKLSQEALLNQAADIQLII